MQYSIVGNEDGTANVTVFAAGRAPLVAHSDHPNFDKIVEGVHAGDESVIDLFDVAQSAATKFERLTERVTTANGRLYLDGEEVHDALADQVVRFLSENVEDWKPLVNFFENVQNNPQEHSREQLYTWLSNNDFSINEDGLIVGYKGVNRVDEDTFASTRSGKAIVNGEVQTGYIKQSKGDVVEMPRSEVVFDPADGCNSGLHISNFNYASTYGNTILEVHVNPRDVVSVPTDTDWQKVRACRYTVINTIESPYASAAVYSDEYLAEEDDYGYDGGWGDGEDEDDYFGPDDQLQVDFTEPVADLEDDVQVGDTFETTDKRRAGTTFVVESIEGDVAVGKSLPRNLTRKVALDRLTSYRYTKV